MVKQKKGGINRAEKTKRGVEIVRTYKKGKRVREEYIEGKKHRERERARASNWSDSQTDWLAGWLAVSSAL